MDEVSVLISQSISLVFSAIWSATSEELTSESSSRIIYMLTESVDELIRLIVELPPAVAPIVSIPSISDILSITSSDKAVSSSKSSFSSSFAAIVTDNCFVSMSISIKVIPFEIQPQAETIKRAMAAINTSGLNLRQSSRNFP